MVLSETLKASVNRILFRDDDITVFASFVCYAVLIGSVLCLEYICAEPHSATTLSLPPRPQLIFGLLIVIFPVIMIFVGQLGKRIKAVT